MTSAELDEDISGSARLRAQLGATRAEVRDLRAELDTARRDLRALAEHRALEAYTHEQFLELQRTAQERDDLLEELTATRRDLAIAEKRIVELESSTSWRWTRPLRRVKSLLRGE